MFEACIILKMWSQEENWPKMEKRDCLNGRGRKSKGNFKIDHTGLQFKVQQLSHHLSLSECTKSQTGFARMHFDKPLSCYLD